MNTTPDEIVCDGACGRDNVPCYRLDLGSSGGVFLCRRDWKKEMEWRKLRNLDLSPDCKFDILPFPGNK